MPSRWVLAEPHPVQTARLAEALGISQLAARVLAARGYTDVEAAQRFLRPSLDDLHDPLLMRGMREAVARLRDAIDRREKILLYGDYDVDGTIAVVVLKRAIELAGGAASYHIPDRLREGYGMRADVIERAAAEGTQLVVSVDTGIRAPDAVRRARELGVDVVVTDHHQPDDELPPAFAVLNPKQRGCAYPEKDLCGAGVAFKLVQALLATMGWPADKIRRMTESFIRPVAIATVADVVPLTGENRVIVKHGLDGLRSVRNPGLKALLNVAGFVEGATPSAGQVAFRIAPRLNAAGRMADANDIVSLLLTDDDAEARRLAEKLHALNRERQDTESAIFDACLETRVGAGDFGLVFAGHDWHRGVVGIVANRLVERFNRPVIVLSEDAEEGLAQGSGRSIPGFDLLAALESMPELFERFGGHRQAAGVALAVERIAEFRERFNTYAAARLTPEQLEPEIEVDAAIGFAEITERAIAEVLALAPFGFGNPAPVFAAYGLEAAGDPAALGEKHLRVNLRQNGRTLTLKGWGFAERAAELAAGSRVDAAIRFEPDDYSAARGYPGWCAVLEDVRKAAAATA